MIIQLIDRLWATPAESMKRLKDVYSEPKKNNNRDLDELLNERVNFTVINK